MSDIPRTDAVEEEVMFTPQPGKPGIGFGGAVDAAFARQLRELTDSLWVMRNKPFIEMMEGVAKIEQERDRLRAAIITHLSQKADDRCIEDDDRLYAALGDGVKCDRRVGDKAAMLANCKQLSYAELELENQRLQFLAKDVARYEKLRKLNPRQFHDLWLRNLTGENFDEMVDKL